MDRVEDQRIVETKPTSFLCFHLTSSGTGIRERLSIDLNNLKIDPKTISHRIELNHFQRPNIGNEMAQF